MEGYEVKTVDEEKVGHVVGSSGEFLIVEQGTIRKSKHALPTTFAEIDDSEQVVRITVSKDVVDSSPKMENGSIDERAVREHYGLAQATEVNPPGSAEGDAARAGVETAPQERVRTRKEMDVGEAGLPEDSPALLGDRVAGVDEREQQKRQ